MLTFIALLYPIFFSKETQSKIHHINRELKKYADELSNNSKISKLDIKQKIKLYKKNGQALEQLENISTVLNSKAVFCVMMSFQLLAIIFDFYFGLNSIAIVALSISIWTALFALVTYIYISSMKLIK